jgi:hypothetical protein
MAQRHQAWMAPSESYGLESLPPNSGVQQQTQAVVGLVGPLEQPLVEKARIRLPRP